MGRQANLKSKNSNRLLALHQLPGQLLTEEDLESDHWYEAFPSWPEQSDGGPRGTVMQWSDIAENALASASRMYEKRMNTSPGDAVKRALGKEKTIGDKIAAVTLLVQESPVHRLDQLRTLLSFAQKKGRRERAPAIEAIKDLLLNDLLPGDRRLSFFKDREFSCPKGQLSKRHILYALYESELKTTYREYLQVLEESGKDTLAFFKQKTVKIIYELLVGKPENEKSLLSMLVNKLGDPDRKVSSTASYSLLQLIEKDHPQMRLIVVKEVERLLIRPHITRRTQYYSVCFLNQIRFSDGDTELARKFVRIYMDLFTVCLEEDKQVERDPKDARIKKKRKRMRKRKRANKEDVKQRHSSADAKETRLMGALLVGVNRAFPYTKPEQDDTSYDEYYDSLFHVAHAKSLGPSTNALAFLFQVSQSNSTQSDRFYRAAYSRIYDAANCSEMTQASFLNLVYKAMKADTNTKRVKAFMKRLLQAGCQSTPGFAGACAMVISETFAHGDKGILKSFVSLMEKDDEDEEFLDVDDKSAQSAENDSNSTEIPSEGDMDDPADQATTTPRTIPEEITAGAGQNSSLHMSNRKGYDPSKRDPQYAGADRSSLWEAVTLTSHYHPSVSLFARTICADMKPVSYASDPLKDFSQIAFLDRFSYKKAKNRVTKSLYGKRSARYRGDPLVNSEEFQELITSGNVAEDDLFFARFFSANPDRVQRRDIGDAARETYGSDVDSEEEAFEKAMEAEMRRLGSDEGFFAKGIKDFAGNIDEQDEDEIRAFEKAFEKEMVKSDDEDEDELVDQETRPERDGNRDVDGEPTDVDSARKDSRRVVHDTAITSTSVFAAVEDYAEAIERDLDKRAEERNLNPAREQNRKRKRVGESRKVDPLESGLESSKDSPRKQPEVKPLPPSTSKPSSKGRTAESAKKKLADGKSEHVDNKRRKERKK